MSEIQVQNKIMTTFNQKDSNGNYLRYEIGGTANNISYEYLQNQEKKKTSVKDFLDIIKKDCLNDSLSFELKNPVNIKTSSTNTLKYDGTSSKTIDLSNFITKNTKWNDLGISTGVKKYKALYWVAGGQIQDLSYGNNGWITTPRSQGSGYVYPKYSGSLTYKPTSLCKMTLPEGVYFINYGIQIVNQYDEGLSSQQFTPNHGIVSSKCKGFVSNDKAMVEPGIISGTICSEDRFKLLQTHYYKDYPSDTVAKSDEYFISHPAYTSPRTQGTLMNSDYTGRSFILNVSKQSVYHILATHWHVPTENMKKGFLTDAKGKQRIVCPIGFWMQILLLAPPKEGYGLAGFEPGNL